MSTAETIAVHILQRLKNKEALAILGMERKYLKKRNNGAVYIALEEVDFTWIPKEVGQFDEMWAKGDSIFHIATVFKRKPLEVALLMMDRELKGKIKPRPNGIWG